MEKEYCTEIRTSTCNTLQKESKHFGVHNLPSIIWVCAVTWPLRMERICMFCADSCKLDYCTLVWCPLESWFDCVCHAQELNSTRVSHVEGEYDIHTNSIFWRTLYKFKTKCGSSLLLTWKTPKCKTRHFLCFKRYV